MTAVDNVTSLRQRREAIVRQHAEAENRHDVEATIATFHHPRYEFNGKTIDGAEAVRELLQGFMNGFPDFHASRAAWAASIEGYSSFPPNPPPVSVCTTRMPSFGRPKSCTRALCT